jgi:hypothetical protein
MRHTVFSRTLGERAEHRARGALTDQKCERELAAKLAVVRAKQREDAQIREQIDGPFSIGTTSEAYPTSAATISALPEDVPRASPFEIASKINTLEEYV